MASAPQDPNVNSNPTGVDDALENGDVGRQAESVEGTTPPIEQPMPDEDQPMPDEDQPPPPIEQPSPMESPGSPGGTAGTGGDNKVQDDLDR